jgi:hypothetical protein
LSHRLIKQAPETEEVGGKVMIFPLGKLRSWISLLIVIGM